MDLVDNLSTYEGMLNCIEILFILIMLMIGKGVVEVLVLFRSTQLLVLKPHRHVKASVHNEEPYPER
jgi:hypothetical protein